MNDTQQNQKGIALIPQPIVSPCIRVCTLDRDNVCVGCHRTIDEITRWTKMTHSERLAILERGTVKEL